MSFITALIALLLLKSILPSINVDAQTSGKFFRYYFCSHMTSIPVTDLICNKSTARLLLIIIMHLPVYPNRTIHMLTRDRWMALQIFTQNSISEICQNGNKLDKLRKNSQLMETCIRSMFQKEL